MTDILLVTGSYPPDVCGVGDYSSKLIDNSKSKWKLFCNKDWSIGSIKSIISKINAEKIDNIVMQYPTEGYGWSLVPQILSIYYSLFTKKRFVVTLHEFANRTFKAKVATMLFFFSNKVIFTSDFEKEAAIKVFPWLRKKSNVVNIISNIDSPGKKKSWGERTLDLIYFGHLRPNKGLEDFYEVANKISLKGNVKIGIIGQVLAPYETYFNDLKDKYSNLDICYYLNQSSEDVTELLNDSKFCFLPFPDGLSERRGSFLAAISCGVYVFSYDGTFMTQALRQISNIVNISTAASEILKVKENMTEHSYMQEMSKSEAYLSGNIPKNWSEVVEKYEKAINE